jgi:hypothetical protein
MYFGIYFIPVHSFLAQKWVYVYPRFNRMDDNNECFRESLLISLKRAKYCVLYKFSSSKPLLIKYVTGLFFLLIS